MARVLITGANGHIGANTVRAVLEKGHEVVPFVRETSDLRALEGLDLAYRYGDMRDAASLAAAAEGCDAIIHLAMVYQLWARDPADIIEPAVVGTRGIYEAARQNGVKRILFCSSAAAVGVSADPNVIRTTADWHDDPANPYYISKTLSEREAWKLSEQTGIPTIVINPTMVLGPLDYSPTPSTRFFRDLIDESQPAFKGGNCLVDVRDVAEVFALALEQGTPGKRYLVGGENMTIHQMVDAITDLTGVKPGTLNAPRWMGLLLGGMFGVIGGITGKEPAFTYSTIFELLQRYAYYDWSETLETFSITPRDGRACIAACVEWLLESDAFKPELAAKIKTHFEAVKAPA